MTFVKLEKVLAAVEGERLNEDTGSESDAAYERALDDVLEALRSLPTDDGVTDEMRKALYRQADNMAFILNRVDLPPQWHDKFARELEEDRAAFGPLPAPPSD